jgi:hypothetical protein
MSQISFIALVIGALLLAGCAREAVYADHEFGMANRDAFDRQIINKDYAHAGKPVEGMAGIHAEPIMNTYQKTFSEGFTKEDIDITQVGLEAD